MTLALLLALRMALAAEPVPLTLGEAIARAVAQHPTVAASEARVDQARSATADAWLAFSPSISATGTYTRRPGEVTTNVTGDRTVLQARDALRATGRVDLAVVDLGALQTARAAEKGMDAQRLESDEAIRSFGYLVADAYLDALIAARVHEAAQERAARGAELLEAARARLEVGLGTRNDVTRTELEKATADLEVVRTRGEVERTRVALATLLVVPDPGPLAEPVLAPLPESSSTRGDLLAARERTRQASRESSAQLVDHLPVLGLFGTTTATNEAGFTGRHVDWSAGASATWPLFDGGHRLAAASRARAVAREREAAAEALELSIGEEVEAARVALRTAQSALEVAEIRVEVAERNADEQTERFRQGLSTGLEVSEAAVAEFEARATLARQHFETQRALLDLAEALAVWPEEMVR